MPKVRKSPRTRRTTRNSPPETNALIRALKLGAGSGTKVILIGKDGEKKLEKTTPPDTVNLADFFSAVDQMPQSEKDLAPPAVAEPAAPPAGKAGAKAGKASKSAAPQQLDD